MNNTHVSPTVGTILAILAENGMPSDRVAPVANCIINLILNADLSELADKIPTDLQVAEFESEFDDGSVFRSRCVIDIKRQTIEHIENAGSNSDDASCIEQTVYFDGTSRHVYDEDVDDKKDESDFIIR